MPTAALKLLRAARSASLASRIAAAAVSNAAVMVPRSLCATAAMAFRSSRAAATAPAAAARSGLGVIAPLMSHPTRGYASTKPRDDASSRSLEYSSSADYEHVPDDAKIPSDKDVESDEALWAFYERWCKAFNKKCDHAEMVRRFKIFKFFAESAHYMNTYLPPDPKEAAIYIRKRKKAKLLLSKGQSVSGFEEIHLPNELGQFADGGDPFIFDKCKRLLNS